MSVDLSSPAARDREKLRRRRRRRLRLIAESIAAPMITLSVVVAWQVAVPLLGVSEFVLPTPAAIIERFARDFTLIAHHSLVETLAGFIIAAVAGIATAFAVFYSRVFERAFYPLLVAMQTVPKVALAPLLVLYLGYDFAPKCFLAFLLAYFPIVIATVVGLQGLDKAIVDLVRSMGASEWKIFFKIRLPAALPSIFGGLKVGISLAVIGAVIGEYVAAEQGLGYLQLQASAQFDTTLSFTALVVISVLGVITFWAIELFERQAVFQRDAAK
jgi:NitT/TauT family transport system permease protein